MVVSSNMSAAKISRLIVFFRSIGYGVSLGGISAMLTMLNSCAPGVGVVNIDNGFGAAALAYKCIGGRT